MPTSLHSQTKTSLDADRGLSLPVLQVSPYYGIGRGAFINTNMAKARVMGFSNGGTPGVTIMTWDDSNNYQATWNESASLALTDITSAQIQAAIISSTKTALEADSGFTFADSDYSFVESLFVNRGYNYPSLAVNTSRQASAVQDAYVTAAVDITATLTLSGGTSGKVELKYADDSAFTTNVVVVQHSSGANTGTLTIGLNTAQLTTTTLTGYIPAGKYYRLVTTNVTGTPTYGTPQIQEVLL